MFTKFKEKPVAGMYIPPIGGGGVSVDGNCGLKNMKRDKRKKRRVRRI
jgi:hypothetical protein